MFVGCHYTHVQSGNMISLKLRTGVYSLDFAPLRGHFLSLVHIFLYSYCLAFLTFISFLFSNKISSLFSYSIFPYSIFPIFFADIFPLLYFLLVLFFISLFFINPPFSFLCLRVHKLLRRVLRTCLSE